MLMKIIKGEKRGNDELYSILIDYLICKQKNDWNFYNYEKQHNNITVAFHIGVLSRMSVTVIDICNGCKQLQTIGYKCKNPKCLDSGCKMNCNVCVECSKQYGFVNKKLKVCGSKRKRDENKNNDHNIDTEVMEVPNKKQKILYCICRKEFDDSMIGCDNCLDGWYHPGCLNLSGDDLNEALNKHWSCPQCI
eukprot:526688_1